MLHISEGKMLQTLTGWLYVCVPSGDLSQGIKNINMVGESNNRVQWGENMHHLHLANKMSANIAAAVTLTIMTINMEIMPALPSRIIMSAVISGWNHTPYYSIIPMLPQPQIDHLINIVYSL